MSTIFARSPLTSLPMATNRPSTRRRSAKQAFDDDDAPAPKRVKADLNGNSKKAATTTTTKKTTKVAYDENDDGFQFSRRTSRRTTKAQVAPLQESIPEEKVAKPTRRREILRSSPDPPPAKAPARRKKSIATIDPESSDAQNRRRSARISGDRNNLEIRSKSTEPLPPKRTGRKAPAEPQKKKQKQVTPAPEAQPKASAFAGAQTPTQQEGDAAKERDPNARRIMLPFADTPVITRNKEMRKGNKDGHRRSSTGLRGRRASSLIDSGMSNALPHSAIEVADYYKYIEQSLPEPRRMKQLLTWCGSQALPKKPSGDVKNANAIMAARAIQQELIDDFANRPELSDWFSREETVAPPAVKKPNPTNEKNKITLQELEEEVKRLEEEKAAWESLEKSAPSVASVPPPPSSDESAAALGDIDTSVLDPAQVAILSKLQLPSTQTEEQPTSTAFTFTFTTPSALQSHLSKLSQSLEPNIDIFADGVHKIEQYRNAAERVADRVLGTAAKRLEDRDREVKERAGADGIGVGDVLRGLAGVLGES
ncbi:cell division [Ascochyta rabiei]|uniref:Cell division n=2 Tax=Didymella rabiei TaxID=5454 RepID=A0A163JQK7_DIDRA|nr:cell division [Ascochyta rabiei]